MSRPWAINAGLRSRREPPETMFFLENFLTREASYKPSYFTSWNQSGPSGTMVDWHWKAMGVRDSACSLLSAVHIFRRHLHGACPLGPWPVSLDWAVASFDCRS